MVGVTEFFGAENNDSSRSNTVNVVSRGSVWPTKEREVTLPPHQNRFLWP